MVPLVLGLSLVVLRPDVKCSCKHIVRLLTEEGKEP